MQKFENRKQTNPLNQEPITRSLHLAYKTYETSFACIFLFLETAGLLDSRSLYAIQYNIIQHHTTQHNTIQTLQCNTIQYITIHNILSWEFKLAWGEKCSRKIEKYTERLIQGYMGHEGSR